MIEADPETEDLAAVFVAVALGETPCVGDQITMGCVDSGFPSPWCPKYLSEAFGVVENQSTVRGAILGIRLWADIRQFGRDVIDMETKAVKLKAGLQGRLWGVPIFVSRAVHRDRGWVVGQCADGTWVRQEVGYGPGENKEVQVPS